MDSVGIAFKNGTKMRFFAQEFDIDLDGVTSYSLLTKFTYTDANGNQKPLFLMLEEVAGITVAPLSTAGKNQIYLD